MPPKQKNSKGRKFAKARGRRRSRGRRRISGFEKSQEDRFIRPVAPAQQWSAGTGYKPVRKTAREMQYFENQFRNTTKKNSPRLQPSMSRIRSKNLPTRAKPSTGGLSWGQNDRNIRMKRERLTGPAPGTPSTPGTPLPLSPWTNIPQDTPPPFRIYLDDEVEQGSSKIESEARIESKTPTTSVGGVKKRKTKKRRKTKRKGGRRKTKKRRKTKRGGKRKRRKSRRRR
mgnify:CR=1 FL=1|jgi:hypothetical protein